jgi:hypothetical protein
MNLNRTLAISDKRADEILAMVGEQATDCALMHLPTKISMFAERSHFSPTEMFYVGMTVERILQLHREQR